MPLPDTLERLKHISIDTLGLSESTSALLKWHGITHVLDCLAYFYKTSQDLQTETPWSLLFGRMFEEVKPALIAAGYWGLVLDAEVWQIFHEQNDNSSRRRVVRWQGQEIDLYEISIDALALSEGLPEGFHLPSIGACLDHFLNLSYRDSKYSFALHKPPDEPRNRSLYFHEYMFEVVQPRLVELGYWAFFEAHVDDFDVEEEQEINWDRPLDGDWEPFPGGYNGEPIHHMLLRWLRLLIGWIAQSIHELRERSR